jgi:Ca-activated chloride channel family protein
MTLSHSVLLHLIDKMKPETVPEEGFTNLSDAIILGLKRLHSEDRNRKVLVLLSDGEQTVQDTETASKASPNQAANLAANLHVPIYTIDAGGPIPTGLDTVSKEAARQRQGGIQKLQKIAEITGGHYFQASDTKSLLDVYRKIDGLEKQQIESYQYHRYYEAFPWFGLAAFVLWMTVTILELTYWQRLP